MKLFRAYLALQCAGEPKLLIKDNNYTMMKMLMVSTFNKPKHDDVTP